VTLVRLEYENAWSAMVVTLVPTTTLVRVRLLKNEASPMVVMARPFVLAG